MNICNPLLIIRDDGSRCEEFIVVDVGAELGFKSETERGRSTSHFDTRPLLMPDEVAATMIYSSLFMVIKSKVGR
jgi:hypothetical protein